MPKYLALTLAVGYTIFITVLSFISLNSIPKLGSNFDDKIYHCGAYVLFTLVWYIFLIKTKLPQKIVLASLFVLSYGIIIEVLQGALTTYRQEDFTDIIANGVGVASALMLILILKKFKVKIN